MRNAFRRPLSAALAIATLGASSAVFNLTARAQEQAATPAPVPLTIQTPAGPATAFLTVPQSPARPPVIAVVSLGDGSLFARSLAAEGVAVLQVTAKDAPSIAQWLAHLRNDERFPTTTVYTDDALSAEAVLAARTARADGIVSAPGFDLKIDLSHVVAARLEIQAGTPGSYVKRIAEFARTVPVLGRRGTSAARPVTARRSPRQVLLATVGTARIGLEWGSPQKRGREIWGGIVKWNDVWMPGADEATTLTTSTPIRIGTLMVPAGDHTLYTVPGPDRFQLIISNDVGQFHTVHDATKELGRIDLTAGTRADSVEGLTFSIEPRENGAVLKLSWDTREFTVPVSSASTSLARR